MAQADRAAAVARDLAAELECLVVAVELAEAVFQEEIFGIRVLVWRQVLAADKVPHTAPERE